MKLDCFCKGVYSSCGKIKSQTRFIELLFIAAGNKVYISDSYKKGLFNGSKPFSINQKIPLRNKGNVNELVSFFDIHITDENKLLLSFGIPEKEVVDKKALSAALALQLELLIDSDLEEVEDIIILEYQKAKKVKKNTTEPFFEPLYIGDSSFVHSKGKYEIESYDTIQHTWQIQNTGNIYWSGRKLVYRRGLKDRPEANPSELEIGDVRPGETIKITTTFDGRGFDGVTSCIWEMQDSDGANCFPNRDSLFCVIIDAKYKRNINGG